MKKKQKTISKLADSEQLEQEPQKTKILDPQALAQTESTEPEIIYENSESPLEEGKPKNELGGRFSKNRIIDKLMPDKTLLINMELRNGMHRTFMIKTKKDSFKFMGGRYLIDTNLKYYKVDSKIWCLDYHQDLSLPVKRVIPVSDITKAIEASGVCEVESAASPALLERFIKAEVAEGVMKGAPVDEALKKILMIAAVGTIAAIAHLLIFMFKTGMLSSVRIPGM